MTSETTIGPRQPGYVVAGKYRVDRVLGEGGMGVVVAATHEQLEQKVALKFLLPDVAAVPELVQRFMREARAAVKIHSEHVARVLDVGTDAGAPYMVMEYLEGSDLSQVLEQRGPLPVEDAVGYVLQACEAIAEAHALGIIHRDLKPANLFLATRPSGAPAVKVLDFGISKAPATAKEASVTRTSSIMGSPAYMSPEQMASASTVDVRADVWSLGVVLYEMLVKKLPFDSDTMPGLVAAILQNAPSPIADVRTDLPPALEAVIQRCLQKLPANRFANVAELARALLPFGPRRSEQSVERIEHVLGKPSSARVAPPPTSASTSAVSDIAATFAPTTSQAVAPRRGKLRVAAPLIGLVVIGIVVLAFFGLRTAPRGAVQPPSAAIVASVPAPAPSPSAPIAVTPSASIEPIEPTAAATPSATTSTAPKQPLRPFAYPSTSSASAPSGPKCKTVSYFDADGNKHFKQVCP